MIPMTREQMEDNLRKDLGTLASNTFINWLDSIGYFEAPAAKGHHGAYTGGLFDHSYTVAQELNNMNKPWDRPESPFVVGYLHDICKVDDYICTENENCKDVFDYNPRKIMPGHGDKSVLMLVGHFNLTEEEARCIQFHMGAFTDKDQWQYYSKAVHDFPNVLYTHTADMIASQILDV